MPIEWLEDASQLHLHNETVSLVLRVLGDGSLGLTHVGARLAIGRSYAHLDPRPFAGFANRVGDPVPLAVPTAGSGDFRIPAIGIEGPDGSSVLELRYAGHRILPAKPPIPGLPSTYVESDDEAETVEIRLADARTGAEVTLVATIYAGLPVIARSLRVRNGGTARLRLTCAMSASLDLPDADWQLSTLSGAWARERHVRTAPLRPGRQSVGSLRGASSLEHNPFLLMTRSSTTEEQGEALGLSLVYSGNFLAEAEVDPFATTRVRIGIHPDAFTWQLDPDETFATPEAIIVHTLDGLDALSAAYHRLFRERLVRGPWRDRPRPVLINNWEATYFDFDEPRLVTIAESARDLGIELFVLDDGWFGRRDADNHSLGDWHVDRRKLPNGLEGLARRVIDLGLDFGLWIEPEMVSEASELFAAHPDWAVGVPGRPRTPSRQQLVLDLARPAVVDHLFEVIAGVLASAPISYVKWDMNRSITEPYSASLPPERQGEFFHRYILGVYDLYDRLTRAFPDVLFESCASGGGRFDPGMLAYAPQTWTSDDTDAVERLAIQWGTSLAYPLSTMGAHVSAVPNHQTGRLAPIEMRAAVAMFGVFGYELDPTTLTYAERTAVAEQIAFYREHRPLFQFGRFRRLRGPSDGDGNETAWMTVSDDARRAVVGVYRVLNRPTPGPSRIRLRGLDPGLSYRVTVRPASGDPVDRANRGERTGSDLMTVGLILDAERHEAAEWGDFRAWTFLLEAI